MEVGEKVESRQSEALEMSKRGMKVSKEGMLSQKKEEKTKKDTEIGSEKMMIEGKEVSKKEIMFGAREISESEKQLMIGLKEGNEEESRITPIQRKEIEKRMGTSFIPVVIIEPFDMMMEKMKAAKTEATELHNALLQERYDLSNRPAEGLKMSRGKPIQEGVRVKLPEDMSWEKLSTMSPEEIQGKRLFPQGFMPLPHPNHAIGGMVLRNLKLRKSRGWKVGI